MKWALAQENKFHNMFASLSGTVGFFDVLDKIYSKLI